MSGVEMVSKPDCAMLLAYAYAPWLACACCGKRPPERAEMVSAGSYFPDGGETLHGYILCKACHALGPEESARRVEANAPSLPSFSEEGVVIIGDGPHEVPS